MYYTVDTTIGDADHDGLPDGWEIANGLNPSVPDALANPAGDGLANLMKFALGLNPRLASLTGTPQVFIGNAAGNPVASGETGYLTMSVNRNPAASGLQFKVEISSDLATWQSGPGDATVLLDTPPLLKVRDNTPVSGNQKRNIRLKVSAP